ncbi:MAG: hypothetical protein IID03_03070 [Candidatus Dadabacteria bacterium]|nr:hypothetical protein [Candidatus Dadabacteria bacterium]
MFIYKVVEILQNYNIEYAIAGGYAVALHGAVRGTVDIDLVIKLDKNILLKIEYAFKEIGLQSRLPLKGEEVFNFREEYIKNRNLIAWNFININNPAESVDILLTEDLKKIRTKTIKSGIKTLKIVSVNDLIKMKNKSGGPQDLEDIKSLRSLKK